MEFLESFDQGFWNFLQAKRQPWLDPLLAALTFLARPLVLLAVAGIGAATLAYRRRFAEAGAVAASCGGAFLLALALGWLVDRPPPTVVLRPLEDARRPTWGSRWRGGLKQLPSANRSWRGSCCLC